MDSRLTQKGFTLVEVLVVTVLLALAFLVFLGALNFTKEMQSKSKLRNIQSLLLHDVEEQIKSKRYDESTNEPWSSSLGTDGDNSSYLTFDGANDRVLTPVDADRDVMPSTTWSGWIKPVGVHGWQVIFGMEDGGWDRTLFIEGGGLGLSMGHTSGRWITGASVSPSVWQHVVAVYDNGVMRFYYNGTEYISGNDEGSHSSGSTFVIGGNNNGSFNLYKGGLDEVAVWDEALTASEIIDIYNSGNRLNVLSNSGNYTSSTNLAAYWTFNDGSGTTVTDLSSNNNNASIVPTNYGGTWTAIETGETVLSQFDDIDDFNGFNISSFNEHPAFSADVEVDYANLDTKFRIKSSSPTNYKRVIVTISHTALSSLSDTLIIGSGL